jgi:biopolymer transport protein ExbB
MARRVRAQMSAGTAEGDTPLARVWAVYQANPKTDIETLELKLDDAILKEMPALEKYLALLKLLSGVAPLMGLLGTVTGMILTFQAITLFGTGDPKLMAGGISQALVTTVLGLVVAIPILLLHAIAATRSREIVQILEEQAAGLIAAHAEAK